MSITKAGIVTVLNNRLKRAETETTIAEEIKAGLKFVSEGGLWPCLWKDTSGEETKTKAGDKWIPRPTNFRVLDEIRVFDGVGVGPPLDEISFQEWLKNNEEADLSDESCYDEPKQFAQRGEYFWLWPKPDENDGVNYIVRVYFWQYHPDQAEILFPDCFKEAIYNAVMGKYLEGKGPAFADAATYYLNISLREMDKLPQDTQFSHVKYNDI